MQKGCYLKCSHNPTGEYSSCNRCCNWCSEVMSFAEFSPPINIGPQSPKLSGLQMMDPPGCCFPVARQAHQRPLQGWRELPPALSSGPHYRVLLLNTFTLHITLHLQSVKLGRGVAWAYLVFSDACLRSQNIADLQEESDGQSEGLERHSCAKPRACAC